jgi:hypothetical protein
VRNAVSRLDTEILIFSAAGRGRAVNGKIAAANHSNETICFFIMVIFPGYLNLLAPGAAGWLQAFVFEIALSRCHSRAHERDVVGNSDADFVRGE